MSMCYLDGRLINLVLEDIGCEVMAKKSMMVTFVESEKEIVESYDIAMKFVPLHEGMNIVRVVLQSQYMRHSTVLFLDTSLNKGWWWNPRSALDTSERSAKLHAMIKTFITEFMKKRAGKSFKLQSLDDTVEDTTNSECEKSGLCNALVLKYVMDWHNGDEFDSSQIREFSTSIREKYSARLTRGYPDVEYDFSPNRTMIGGLGGMMIGGALGGTGGAILGGTLGMVGANRYTKEDDEEEEKEDDYYSAIYSKHDVTGYSVSDSRY